MSSSRGNQMLASLRTPSVIAAAFLALLALFALSACGDDPAPLCVPAAADTCACPDGRLGGMVCLSDMTWSACMCREDGGTDASTDATPDAVPDAAADTTPLDAG
jgi:hypothetical protein